MSNSNGLSPVGGGLSSLGGENSGAALSPVGGAAPTAAPSTPPGLSGLPSPSPAPVVATAPSSFSPPPSMAPAKPYPYSSGGATASYDDAPTGPNKILVGGLGTLIAALAAGAFFLFRTPPPVPAPTGYAPFTSADNAWSMETPTGWHVSASGAAGGDTSNLQQNGVTLTSGNAKIEVTISTVSALMTGQLLFGNEVVPEAMGGSKASGVAKLQKKAVTKRWKGYAETVSPDCPNGMGGDYMDDNKKFVADARLYEWTAASNTFGLGGKMHGYRASEAGGQLIAAVVCECSDRDWATLKPAFRHVLGSVHELKKPGGGKGSGGMSIPGMGGTRVPL